MADDAPQEQSARGGTDEGSAAASSGAVSGADARKAEPQGTARAPSAATESSRSSGAGVHPRRVLLLGRALADCNNGGMVKMDDPHDTAIAGFARDINASIDALSRTFPQLARLRELHRLFAAFRAVKQLASDAVDPSRERDWENIPAVLRGVCCDFNPSDGMLRAVSSVEEEQAAASKGVKSPIEQRLVPFAIGLTGRYDGLTAQANRGIDGWEPDVGSVVDV